MDEPKRKAFDGIWFNLGDPCQISFSGLKCPTPIPLHSAINFSLLVKSSQDPRAPLTKDKAHPAEAKAPAVVAASYRRSLSQHESL